MQGRFSHFVTFVRYLLWLPGMAFNVACLLLSLSLGSPGRQCFNLLQCWDRVPFPFGAMSGWHVRCSAFQSVSCLWGFGFGSWRSARVQGWAPMGPWASMDPTLRCPFLPNTAVLDGIGGFSENGSSDLMLTIYVISSVE